MSSEFFASMLGGSLQYLDMPMGKSLNLSATLSNNTDFLTTSVIPTALDKSNNSDFSISLWVKHSNFSNTGGLAGVVTLGSQYQFSINFQNAKFTLNHTAGEGYKSYISTNDAPISQQWVHYVINVVSGFATMFVNGVNLGGYQFKAGLYPTLSGLALSGSDRLKIGVNSNYMKIQDVCLYSVALSTAQIAAVYNTGIGINLSTVSQVSSVIDAYYSFNETLSPIIGTYGLIVNSSSTPIYSYDKK